MELEYTKQGDYMIPNLTVGETLELGKYGRLRAKYLKEHRNGIYSGMLLSGNLNSHLMEIDKEAEKMMEDLIRKMAAEQNVTEKLKAEDQMKWVGLMNNIKSAAEEIVLNQLIYA